MQPVVLLLAPSPQASERFEEPWLSFRFTLIKLYELPAQEFVSQADIHLLKAKTWSDNLSKGGETL